MDLNPDQTTILTKAFADFAVIIARNTAGAVYTKVSVIKQDRDKTKQIAELESIINDLITDKQELEAIVQTLKQEFVAQQISDSDIDYIVNTVIPLFEDMMGEDSKQKENIDNLKKLLSSDTLKIMQLIGFNYKDAIGKPLTNLCASAIDSLAAGIKSGQDQAEMNKLLAQLSMSREAHNRFVILIGRKDLIDNNEQAEDSEE